MAYVFDEILEDVKTTVEAALTTLGYTDASVKTDPWGLVDFPPEEDVGQVQCVIRAGKGAETRPQLTNCDRYTEDIYVEVALGNGTLDQGEDLGTNAEEMLRELIKALREDLTRGGKCDPKSDFEFNRFGWGDGTGVFFTIHFPVLYRTAYNDPTVTGMFPS